MDDKLLAMGHQPLSKPSENATHPLPDRRTGVVLAGGASRRMGRDKARMPIDDTTWLEHAARRLAAVCRQVLIADRGVGDHPLWPSIDDGPGRGPAAGILGAHRKFPQHELLVLACDLPAVPVSLLRHLATSTKADLVIPRHGDGIEPLCALYRPRALQGLEAQVAAGDYALHHLAAGSSDGMKPWTVHCIETTVIARWGEPKLLFSNLNTPQDVERFKHHLDTSQTLAASLARRPHNG